MMVPAWMVEVAYCAVVPTGIMIGLVVLGLVYQVDRGDKVMGRSELECISDDVGEDLSRALQDYISGRKRGPLMVAGAYEMLMSDAPHKTVQVSLNIPKSLFV